MDGYLLGEAVVLLLSTATMLSYTRTVPFDIYHTSMNTFFDNSSNQTVIDYTHPVHTDIVHDSNLGETIMIASVATTAYLLITRAMIQAYDKNGSRESLNDPFSLTNPEIASSPAMLLWNSSFALVLVATHFILLAVTITPCSVEYIALSTLLTAGPLVYICMPRAAPEDHRNTKPVLLCGIPNHLGWMVLYIVYSLYAASSIRYDPTGYRYQVLLLACTLDVFLLGIGHLWDFPPAINTVMNCRTLYIAVTGIAIIVLMYVHAQFPTRYV
jgi:hypothetical protein